MPGFGSSFVFSLGGSGLSGGKPWVVNFAPAIGSLQAKLLRPIRFSFRDAETFVVPSSLLVEVGYAKVHSEAEEPFDNLPRTSRFSLIPGYPAEASIAAGAGGVTIEKATVGSERSVYRTLVEGGPGYANAMVSAVVRPLTNTSELVGEGSVLGIEHGPRNKVAYLWFQRIAFVNVVRLTSYLVDGGSPSLDTSATYDWSAVQRYTIIWNEVLGNLEVYADLGGESSRLFSVPISSIPDMPDGYFAKAGGAGDVAGIYGQTGNSGDKSLWSNVAVTTDVGFPLIGNIRPGYFITNRIGAELVRFRGGEDPLDRDISPWLDAPDSLYPSSVPHRVTSGDLLKLAKETPGSTNLLYREEPGFLKSSTEGFMIEAIVSASFSKQVQAGTGAGFVIYDGQSIFQLQLFNDFALKTIGLRKKLGNDVDITEQFLPTGSFDWSGSIRFRFVVDPRQNRIKLYKYPDLTNPVLNLPLDRAQYETAADRGWSSLTNPFVAFGHVSDIDAEGALNVYDVAYCHQYQSWDSSDGPAPDDVLTNPIFSVVDSGTGIPTHAMVDGLFKVAVPAITTSKFSRAADFGVGRGAILETRLKVSQYSPSSNTGVRAFLDDGIHSYALGFSETILGRFVALSVSDGLGFKEIVGKDGIGAKLSFQCDWTELHTYRLEVRPLDGLYLFLDDELSHRLYMAEADYGQLADSQYSTPTLAFGQFGGEGATSEWAFVRGFFSSGYEVSFKKNKPDSVLRDELFASQVIVVAQAMD